MALRRNRTGSGLTAGACWCGMGLILASIFLNFGYDRLVGNRLKGDGSEQLPAFLATLYDTGGKQGVTIFFVAIGLAIILFGVLVGRSRKRKAASEAVNSTVSQPYFYSTTPGEEVPESPMALKTRKYLSQSKSATE